MPNVIFFPTPPLRIHSVTDWLEIVHVDFRDWRPLWKAA